MTDNPEIIYDKNKNIIAIIIYQNYKYKGINFVTPDEFSLQLGLMNRPVKDIVPAHIHVQQERQISGTQEVLFVVNGKMKIYLYDNESYELANRILQDGDLILLAFGGHKIEMITEVNLIEVKQGPYKIDQDKFYL